MKKNVGRKLGIYPTPVVVVGTYDKDGKPNLITLAWAGICCSEPPSVQISIRRERYSHKAIMERRAFSVNVPSVKYLAETDYAGMASGQNADKFKAANLTSVRGELADAPMVLEFPISMECRLTHCVEVGSHDLFVGEILACWIEEEVLQPSGRPDPQKVAPLVFIPGSEYFALGELLSSAYGPGKKLMRE
ncbi:MAG: flavin reductase family protein [Synergistaceae bacterium]|nr:flavin reductase family protein [Synergistaceae bacterium]